MADRTPATLPQRLWANIAQIDGHWMWTGTTDPNGYGFISVEGKMLRAHRVAYETFTGTEIPDGFHIDHLCRTPGCVNPVHLEPVTPRVNILRGISFSAVNAAKTHCKHGHEFSEENTYIAPGSGQRRCRICLKEQHRRLAARRKAARRDRDATLRDP